MSLRTHLDLQLGESLPSISERVRESSFLNAFVKFNLSVKFSIVSYLISLLEEEETSDMGAFKDRIKIKVFQTIKHLETNFTENNDRIPSLNVSLDVSVSTNFHNQITAKFPEIKKLKSQKDANELIKDGTNELITGILDIIASIPHWLQIEPSLSRPSIFLSGKYKKFSRKISQSIWFVNSEEKPTTSIEEKAIEHVKNSMFGNLKVDCTFLFSASGREDMDVRMLGDGREFALELANCDHLDWLLNSDGTMKEEFGDYKDENMHLFNFRLTTGKIVKYLATASETHTKVYECVVCVVKGHLEDENVKSLESIKDLVVKQYTPVRTLHRRVNACRDKVLHKISVVHREGNIMRVRLETAAGFYVKEFVHGDLGRTTPSLGDLLYIEQMDILQLDVLGVENNSH
jgi:tRNA pseudouridine(54/55) synthase